MPPKKRPPAPIDRPLSKAYLREFSGWSTEFPPGLSEPNSIRDMRNVQITREGAARVRPGLRSYLQTRTPYPLVGSHEVFYTEHGKAYLVAVRETVDVGTEDEREIVGFRVIGDIDGSGTIVMDTLANFGFEVPADPNAISFTSRTTYVKYLQIDNKIFALSNAPESMVMFWVGSERRAKKLQSIVRPYWDTADKLNVVQPLGAWVDGNVPTSTRRNLVTNPDFETNINGWRASSSTTRAFWTSVSHIGDHALGGASVETKTNYNTRPLHDIATYGIVGWHSVRGTLSISGTALRITADKGASNAYAISDRFEVPAGERMHYAYELVGGNNVKTKRVWIRFRRSNGDLISTVDLGGNDTLTPSIRYVSKFTVPTQAKYAQIMIGLEPASSTTATARIDIKNVICTLADTSRAMFTGDDGADYYWVGAVNDSASVYHPAKDVSLRSDDMPITPGTYTVSAYQHAEAGRTMQVQASAYDSDGTLLLTETQSLAGTGAYVRNSVTIVVPPGATRLRARVRLLATPRGSYLRSDAILVEEAGSAGVYFSGATPNDGTTKRRWAGTAHASVSIEEVFDASIPTARVPEDDTLISSNQTKNKYTFSYFYTISNELGESAASQMTAVRVQRPWTAWEWKRPNGDTTEDPLLCVDQLVAIMPQAVFDAAVSAGATKWTAYFYTQGPNEAPPVTAVRFAEVDLTNEPEYVKDGYVRLTPQFVKIGTGDPLVPSESTRLNASDPMKGSQGLVAADRLITVGNPADPARISWSSGAPGDYHNFSSLLGGGTKQLTSGNLYTTACVKLWQNPQSVDTLTVLNLGDDGRSNAYYMQPAEITSLSESIKVMGFEEVTGMMGTIAPYGCEVVANALYRPQNYGLYKSTANNYNITTKVVSETIQNMWRTLQNPHRIVSSHLDSRIYFLVHNIFGEALEENCRGNEVWVLDVAADTPTWSRWLVQGNSLRAMDVASDVMMSIVRPDGIFTFNEDRYDDERFNADTGDLEVVNIPWYLETNTQGANRAHDAWANVQQSNVIVGNFLGQMRYGIKGRDVNGMDIHVEKVLLSEAPPLSGPPDDTTFGIPAMPTLHPTEREDFLLIRKVMKEWVFFAGSVDDTTEVDEAPVLVPRFSGGQINFVQYRYTPATVNVGYEFGSVETFEYGASELAGATTDSGVPKPYVDLSRT